MKIVSFNLYKFLPNRAVAFHLALSSAGKIQLWRRKAFFSFHESDSVAATVDTLLPYAASGRAMQLNRKLWVELSLKVKQHDRLRVVTRVQHVSTYPWCTFELEGKCNSFNWNIWIYLVIFNYTPLLNKSAFCDIPRPILTKRSICFPFYNFFFETFSLISNHKTEWELLSRFSADADILLHCKYFSPF